MIPYLSWRKPPKTMGTSVMKDFWEDSVRGFTIDIHWKHFKQPLENFKAAAQILHM
jgi:hypothetical protein